MTKASKMKGRRKTHARRGKTSVKNAAEMRGGTHRKTTTKVAPQQTKAAKRGRELGQNQVPDSMRALTESGVAQTRELYERSKNAVQAMLESWHESFGAAGRGAVAVNRKAFDMAERNISSSFDLANDLAGARNLAEAIELQTIYWRKQFGYWRAQAEEMRALSTKLTSNIAEPLKARVTRLQKLD